MTLSSLMDIGVQGMQYSQQKITSSANEIAQAAATEKPEQSTRDLAEPLVEMKIEQKVFDASAKVVSTADETLGTLLDTRA